MKSARINIRPLQNLAGSRGFCELSFENVRVAKTNMLGEKNRGWYTAAATLDFERSGIGPIAPGRRILERLIGMQRAGELGLRGNAQEFGPDTSASQRSRFHLNCVPLTITGGTSEVMCNIVATRAFGLPRG